jgi:peroxiredoxin
VLEKAKRVTFILKNGKIIQNVKPEEHPELAIKAIKELL